MRIRFSLAQNNDIEFIQVKNMKFCFLIKTICYREEDTTRQVISIVTAWTQKYYVLLLIRRQESKV